MGRRFTLLACSLSLLIFACGDDGGGGTPDASTPPPPPGPFDELDLSLDLHFDGLDGPVHVARDRFGIAHIHATTVADLGFAQGFVMAHDRLPQMDILRRFGAGTLGELFGALDADIVETDLEMRMHRMKPLAQQAYDELLASSDPADAEIVTLLDRFADGVNAYNAALVAGKFSIDPAIAVSYDPARFQAWSPIDSLVLGRFQAFALSWTAPLEVDITDVYQQATAVFDDAEPADPAAYARRGASLDLVPLRPIGDVATVEGFPNVEEDTGTRSGGPALVASRQGAPGPATSPVGVAKQTPTARPRTQRPRVPRELLRSARHFFRKKMKQGPHSFMAPRAGSNNWIVGPQHAGGKVLLAGDQHLSQPNPSIFYPVHLTIPGEIDAQGISFPGIPGLVLGHNARVAWTSTTVFHDVNDVYLETIVPCSSGGGDCVMHDGAEVAIEPWTEEIRVGALGTITETKTVTYEMVPHHGPIIPEVADRDLVPRTGNTALSVRYTGHLPSHEIRATWGLLRAENVDDAFAALSNFTYGGQNWVVIDNSGNYAWTSHVRLPRRSTTSFSWDGESNPGGTTPFFVLPGEGGAEWDGFVDGRYIPHAVNPPQGFIVTANSDPVGASFDGNPLNAPAVDGRPLYAGVTYAPGLRTARITELLKQRIDAGETITLDDMAEIQHDSQSTVGELLQAPMVAALAKISTPGEQTADLSAWLADVGAARAARLEEARGYLAAWTLATPPAVGQVSEAERDDAIATTLFNVWMHFFLEEALGDEYGRLDWNVFDVNENLTVRVVYNLLVRTDELHSGLAAPTGQPVLCDDMGTAETIESCDLQIAQALDRAIAWLSSDEAFGTEAMTDWRWGALHTFTLHPLFPEDQLNVPPRNDPDPAIRKGFPSPGDNFVVNRADCTYTDLDFTHTEDGPAQRFLAEIPAGGTVDVKWSLPGGTVYNRESPYYRNLLDEYFIPQRHFEPAFSVAEIVAEGAERWVLRTP